MKTFFILIFLSNAFAQEADVGKLARAVKIRKAELEAFQKDVSQGERCKLRDYACFKREVLSIVKGTPEELISARKILEPYYRRSVKDGFPPCGKYCQEKLRKEHLDASLSYLEAFVEKEKTQERVSKYPTVSSVRLRTLIDLSAFHHLKENLDHLEELVKLVPAESSRLKNLRELSPFKNSVLCWLSPGGPIHDEILAGEKKGGEDAKFAAWMKDFISVRNSLCTETGAIIYRGTDPETRAYYRRIRDQKISDTTCPPGDFACLRKLLREVGITYAEDVEKAAGMIEEFAKNSQANPCDKTCAAETLIRTLQTWITFLSTFEREKLAATMDWEKFPEARYQTITEDVAIYEVLKRVLAPMITEIGTIDPRDVKDEGLRSELQSVSKDLSDFASVKFLRDSVICTMEPWNARYDRYLAPFETKAANKKFEAAFLRFKDDVCP